MNPLPSRPSEMAQDWLAETKLERLQSCRIYLRLEGLITVAENEVIKERLRNYKRKRTEELTEELTHAAEDTNHRRSPVHRQRGRTKSGKA